MGAFDTKVPGGTSGVTADDMVTAPDIGKVAPGRRNLVQSKEVGDQYIDHGAVCDGKDETTAGCFMDDRQRERLIGDFKLRVETAATNYKIALTDMRVDELVKKDEDLNWVLSLALDLVGAHFIGVAARALKTLKSSTVAKLAEAGLDANRRGTYDANSLATKAEVLLHKVSDKNVEDKTKLGFDTAKTFAKTGLKNGLNADAHAGKAMSLSFIEQLKESCDEGFMKFSSQAAGSANDAELVVLWEGLHPRNHSPRVYKAALEEKLARFKKSGVADIGRKETLDRELKAASIHRDTRVVWVRDYPGDGKQLYYESQEGDYNPTYIGRGDPGSESIPGFNPPGPQKFGARHPREAPKLERLVPDEFKEAALARQELVYGPPETIDPVRDWQRSQGFDPDAIEGRKKPQAAHASQQVSSSPMYPAGSIFAQQPVPLYASGSVFSQSAKKPDEDPLVWNNPSSPMSGPTK